MFPRQNNSFSLLLFVLAMQLLTACKEEDTQPDISLFLPSNFPAPVYDVASNPVTSEGFALGKKLFYDPILSRDSTIACGSCHIPYSSFSHVAHSVSHGIDDKLGIRNAPPVMNMLWHTTFFWDGGVHTLDLVPFNAIQNPVEMDENIANVYEKLSRQPIYRQMFKDAFGSEDINTQTFAKALSQFSIMLVSANSKYDKYMRNETGGQMTVEELEGLELFKQKKCNSCHSTDLFTDFSFRNNGIAEDLSIDKGRYLVTLNPGDMGRFKVPSLRNLSHTYPYMHDGSLNTLEAVLNHYAEGVHYTETLDTLLIQSDNTYGIPMTVSERQKIIVFLKTLNDPGFNNDPRFAE
ncbi:MAG: cytochrome-c peroxidase [Sphingobacteriales bacterium]|nr:MAG: cytochrome-c peroxidase [Sphingobacteriales bacterium]